MRDGERDGIIQSSVTLFTDEQEHGTETSVHSPGIVTDVKSIEGKPTFQSIIDHKSSSDKS